MPEQPPAARKRREHFANERHRSAFDKGVHAWFDGVNRRDVPYKDASYAFAWRTGWVYAETMQMLITRLGNEAMEEMRAISDPRCTSM